LSLPVQRALLWKSENRRSICSNCLKKEGLRDFHVISRPRPLEITAGMAWCGFDGISQLPDVK
jgi:hypothetical protein